MWKLSCMNLKKNEDSHEKIKEQISPNEINKLPIHLNINLNKDKKDHNNDKIFQNSSQISLITNASKIVEFGEKYILPFSFKKQSEETTNLRRSEVIKEDENADDYDDLELTF